MSFSDFAHKYNLKSKATSNLKLYEALKNTEIDSKVGIYLRDGLFSSVVGVVKLHPSKGTHWVCFTNENYFDSYGCSSPKKLSKIIKKRNGHRLHSEYKKQGLIKKNEILIVQVFVFF